MINYVTNNPNLSGKEMTKIFAQFPEVGESLNKAIGQMDEIQRRDLLNSSIQVESLVRSGEKEKAVELIDKKLIAAKEAGDDEKVATLETIKTSISAAGDNAAGIAMLFQGAALGEEGYSKHRAELADAQVKLAEESLKKQDLVKAKVEAKKLINGSPIALTKDGEKLVNESVITATKSRVLSDQYKSVADQITGNITSSGLTAKGAEVFKKAWGSQDEQTALKQEYIRLRNSAAVQMLPQGPATDKDIQMVLDGFPDQNANPEMIASFMRGMSKIQKFNADVEDEKADWVTKVGNLGSAPSEIKIKDKVIPAGTRFTEYISERYGKAPSGSNADGTAQTASGVKIPTYEQVKAKYPNMTEEAYQTWAKSKGA